MSAVPVTPPKIGANERLGATLALSLIVHGLLVLGVGFALDDAAPVMPTLDVILSQTSTPLTPKEADFLAAANQEGGGESDVAKRPRASITFEYTMMKGVNDKPEHARQLVKLMRRVPSKVNLIPFNPFSGTRFERSDDEVIRSFQKILLDAHVLTTVRRTRGDDIDAACGQLKGQVLDRTRRQAEFRRKLEGQVDAA